MKTLAWLLFSVAALAASAPGYKVLGKIKIGGQGGWDYVYVDSAGRRLYISHTNQVEVVDLDSEKVVGTIPDTTGVHGIAVADDLGRGFTSNGRANDVTIFDLKTLKVISRVKTGENPDSIIYDPVSKKVFTFNGRSKDSSVIDPKSGEVVATIPLGGKPEFAQVDGKGHIYVNNEDSGELIEIDAKKDAVIKRVKMDGCESPSGLAIDAKKRRLFAACGGSKTMAVVDPDAGKVLATPPIGQGTDGAAFDSGFAFSSNGRDGTITVVGEVSPGKFDVVETVPTQVSARTIAADPKTHKLYLPAAELGAATEMKDGKKGRPQIIPDSFAIVVVGR
jgi:YVTN family beta-propeller protein